MVRNNYGWFWFDTFLVSEAEVRFIFSKFMNEEGLLKIGDPALNAYKEVFELQNSREQ